MEHWCHLEKNEKVVWNIWMTHQSMSALVDQGYYLPAQICEVASK